MGGECGEPFYVLLLMFCFIYFVDEYSLLYKVNRYCRLKELQSLCFIHNFYTTCMHSSQEPIS